MTMISLFQRVFFGEGRRTWLGSSACILSGRSLPEGTSAYMEVACPKLSDILSTSQKSVVRKDEGKVTLVRSLSKMLV